MYLVLLWSVDILGRFPFFFFPHRDQRSVCGEERKCVRGEGRIRCRGVRGKPKSGCIVLETNKGSTHEDLTEPEVTSYQSICSFEDMFAPAILNQLVHCLATGCSSTRISSELKV